MLVLQHVPSRAVASHAGILDDVGSLGAFQGGATLNLNANGVPVQFGAGVSEVERIYAEKAVKAAKA